MAGLEKVRSPWGPSHDGPFDIPGVYGQVNKSKSSKPKASSGGSYTVMSDQSENHVLAIFLCVLVGILVTALLIRIWTYRSQRQLLGDLEFDRSITLAMEYDEHEFAASTRHTPRATLTISTPPSASDESKHFSRHIYVVE